MDSRLFVVVATNTRNSVTFSLLCYMFIPSQLEGSSLKREHSGIQDNRLFLGTVAEGKKKHHGFLIDS